MHFQTIVYKFKFQIILFYPKKISIFIALATLALADDAPAPAYAAGPRPSYAPAPILVADPIYPDVSITRNTFIGLVEYNYSLLI